MSSQAVEAYCAFFQSLTPESLARLEEVFAPEARFCDPFNDVRGIAGIRRVFLHMFATTVGPRFEVVEAIEQDAVAYLRWRFIFRPQRYRGEPWTIEGVSRVQFNEAGKAVEHLDFWDPASQLYARLPLIGRLMAWLKVRLRAG